MTSSSRLAGPSPSIAGASRFVLTTPITLPYLTQFALHKEQLPTLVLADGSVYCGDLQPNAPVPHGTGIMLFRSNVALYQSNVVRRTRAIAALDTSGFGSGDRYGGGWADGRFEGEGILVTATYTYQGSWSEGKPHGKGCMTYSKHYVDRMPSSGGFFDGALSALVLRSLSYLSPFDDGARKPREYMGDFHKVHLRHGTGMMKYYNGDVYEGEWVGNRRQGQGKLLSANGEVYTGQWVADERHGSGRIVYANGTTFKGTMVHDHRHGSGTMSFANGDEYVGQFSNDVIEGEGTMRYKNGDVYEGQWKDNTRHGLGRYTLKRNAVRVEGNFVHGLIHGSGTVEHPGLSTFVGRFDRGERTSGTIFWHDSPARRGRRCYQGEWAGETMHGKGLMWFINGDFYYGQFVQNRRTGLGNMRYAENGAEYSGQFVQDLRHGWGLLQAEDGAVTAGRWSRDRFVEGYEGEWDGRALNGVGHLKLAVRTLLEADAVARASNSSSGSGAAEEGSAQAGHAAALRTSLAHMSDNNTHTASNSNSNDNNKGSRLEDEEELVDFFGIFVDGRRDGMGVLKLPAVLGLPAAPSHTLSSASGSANKSGGKKNKRKNNKNKPQAGLKPRIVRRHVIKGCWQGDVLHCDRAVWAFPTGEVYVGGFVNGLRQGRLGRLWLLDGSVFVGAWWQNAACGAGVYFAKNRRDPIYRRLASPPTHHEANETSDTSAGDKVAQPAGVSTQAGGGTRFGLDALWRVFAAGGYANTRSRRRGTVLDSDEDDEGSESISSSSTMSNEKDGARRLRRRRRGRLLVGYRDHYLTSGTWRPVELSVAQYTTLIAPQIATQTPCLPAHLAPIRSWTTSHRAGEAYAGNAFMSNTGMGSTLQDTGAVTPTSRTPRAAWRGQDVSEAATQARSVALKSKPPATILVGAKSAEGVIGYPSGLRVRLRWRGNYPELTSPYRPCSFYDAYLQWVRVTEDNLRSVPSLMGRSTTLCPSAQSVFTSALRPYAAAEGWGPSSTRRHFYSTSNHHPIEDNNHKGAMQGERTSKEDEAKDAAAAEAADTASSAATTQCSFCGRPYGFFRKATQCTICLRSSCSSCLGALEVDARADVTALLRSSQALLRRVQAGQAPDAEALSTHTEADSSDEKVKETSHSGEPSESDMLVLLQDRTLLASSGQSLPVCGDCMRAVLQELRLATLSIPLRFFRSVLSPSDVQAEGNNNKRKKSSAMHDLPLAVPSLCDTEEGRGNKRGMSGEVTSVPFVALHAAPLLSPTTTSTGTNMTATLIEPERCPAPSAEYMTANERSEADAEVSLPALPQVVQGDTAPLSPLFMHSDRTLQTTPEFSRTSRTILSTPPTSSVLPEMMTTSSPNNNNNNNNNNTAMINVASIGEDVTQGNDGTLSLVLATTSAPAVLSAERTSQPTALSAVPLPRLGTSVPEVSPVALPPLPGVVDSIADTELDEEQQQQQQQQQPFSTSLPCGAAPDSELTVVYRGYTSHNVPHLWGRMWWGARQYYEGGFQLGARHGYGTQYMSNGERYVGLFRHDAWDGPGCYFAEDGAVLQGLFVRGRLHTIAYHGEVDAAMRRHGRGIGYESDGSTYNGEWQHGVRHGTGLMQGAEGTLYAGSFRAGCADGQGKLVTSRSAYYGSFRGGQKHGAGVEFFAECAVQGLWERGLQHGFCRIFDAVSEEVYETTYSHGNERDDCFAPPMMVDDADCVACAQCGATFGLFLRRHHCRLCGEVFCDACSQHRATLPAHFFTTNTVTTGNSGGGITNSSSSEVELQGSAAAAQEQAQLILPQRICDLCFQRLEQRRMLALRRYADGAVYAGCWSQGQWVSRGLYCRPDGVCIVMNAHGKPLLPAHSGLDAFASTSSNAGQDERRAAASKEKAKTGANRAAVHTPPQSPTTTPTKTKPKASTLGASAALLDCSPTRAVLDALPGGSSMRDVDAFVIWWASTSTRCRCRVLLDVPLLQRYYADQSQQQQQQQQHRQRSQGHADTNEEEEDNSTARRAASVERLSYPSIPDTPAPHLFVAGINNNNSNSNNNKWEEDNNGGASISAEASMDRDAVEAASLRAARFVPAIIPAMPRIDLSVEHALCLTDKHNTRTNTDEGEEREESSVGAVQSLVPPALDEYDLSDETMVRAIQEERQRRFRVATSTTEEREEGRDKEEDDKDEEVNTRKEGAEADMQAAVCLRSRNHCPPLLPPTPPAPADKSNETIAWDTWAVQPLPAICGCHFGPVAAVTTTTQQQRAKDPNATQEGTTTTTITTDKDARRSVGQLVGSAADKSAVVRSGMAEEALYYSCPLWCPVVPPVEEVLMQGKLQRAALLQSRCAQAAESENVGHGAHTPCANENERTAPSKGEEEEENAMRGEGEKWLPAPLHGPFRFSIRVKEEGNTGTDRFVITQVCSEE